MKNSIYSVLRTCALACLAASFAASATQVVQPVKDASGTAFSGTSSTTAWTGTAAVGSVVTIVGRYRTDGILNESGLGLKILYDETQFINPVSVTALTTKCMIAAPQIQTPTTGSSKIVLGWIDTAARSPAGSVGWPYLADPVTSSTAGTSPCLNPSLSNDTGSVVPGEVNLFQFQGTLSSSVGVNGTATVKIIADGNVSYANPSPGMADQTVTITAVAPLACNLDVDGSGSNQALVDGVLLIRNMLGITGAQLDGGLAYPASATRTTASTISPFLAGQNYDVDGSSSQQALVDGVLLIRLMLNLNDVDLVKGLSFPSSATFTTGAAIRANVNSRCGTSF